MDNDLVEQAGTKALRRQVGLEDDGQPCQLLRPWQSRAVITTTMKDRATMV
jgi:hypothetical protein